MKMKYVVSLILVLVALGLMLGVRSVAESAGRQPVSASSTAPTNMLGYVERVNAILKANTAASNLTDQQVQMLMNEAAKTNLGAELLARSSMYSLRSSKAADIALAVRVLEHLRAGRTNEAIRRLEDQLAADVSILGTFLEGSSRIHMPTDNHLESLQVAKDYWQQFPRTMGNPASDAGVNHALSLLEKK